MKRPRRIFLSHSSKDRVFTARLAKVLTAHGVPVFYSRRSIRGAQQWHEEIGRALKECDWFIVVLSPHSCVSDWVKKELLYALTKSRYKNHILPLVCRRCGEGKIEALAWSLPQIQRIDASRDFHSACAEMLRLWGLRYRQ